jgi:UDP-N-acetylglucosamine 1-carboxyvinyltransferase
LRGSEVEIADLRAGATLVLAALAAEGESRIIGTEHVARGYEDMVGKLDRVGARITAAN